MKGELTGTAANDIKKINKLTCPAAYDNDGGLTTLAPGAFVTPTPTTVGGDSALGDIASTPLVTTNFWCSNGRHQSGTTATTFSIVPATNATFI